MDVQLLTHYAVSIVLMGIAFGIYIPAAYYAYKLHKMGYKFNMMVISFLHLVIPDLVLFANYTPQYIGSLLDGKLTGDDDPGSWGWCQISGFIMIASLCASNT